MADVVVGVPWLLTAVPHEHRAFRPVKYAEISRRPAAAWCCLWDDNDFVLAETGVGGAMVKKSLDALAVGGLPRFVFLAGFAGALANDLRIGDGILADAVVGPDGVTHRATFSVNLPNPLGTLLTSDRLIGLPEEKQHLAETTGAAAVDMETSYVAVWCEERGIPWGCLRAITDEAHTPISKDVFALLEHGRVSPWRLAITLARNPAIIRELVQLGRSASKASLVIAESFQQLMARE